ncbi:glycosyltransferase family 4 protein [bacterium]|nr:glycosyltransferase family 4 protein [bacterium]
MRVLLFSNMYPSAKHPVSGIFIQNQVRELKNRHGIDIKLSVSSMSPRSFVGRMFKYLRVHLLSWVNSFISFDLIHVHFGSAAHLIAVSPAILIRRKTLVITFHRGELYNLPARGFGREVLHYFYKFAKALIPVSSDLKEILINEFSLPPEKMFVIDVGCDLSVFRPCLPLQKRNAKKVLGLLVDRFTLLFVGNIIYRKGVDILFDALNKFQNIFEMSILIIGDGPDRQALEALSLREPLKGRVVWCGEKRNDELPQWYAAADAFVLPSRSEGTPTVILEAMASGTPIIASKVGGIPEIISDGVNGLLFESEKSEQLCVCLEKLLRDPSLRQRLAENAINEVVKHSLQRQVEKIVAIYRSLT